MEAVKASICYVGSNYPCLFVSNVNNVCVRDEFEKFIMVLAATF